MIGERTECREVNDRRLAGFAGPIGGIAQRLERRSGPADREPVDGLGDHRTGGIVGELRDAGDRFLAGRKTFETSRPRRIDRRLHRTGLEGDDHATIGLHLLEGRPGGFAEAVRERLDETGTGGRVDETVDTGLLDQQVVDVAGVPASERGVGAVERQDGHRVGAADTSAERRRRRAEHVHRRIAAREHRRRRDGMESRRVGVDSTGGEYRTPQGSGRTQPGDREELIGIRSNPEADGGSGPLDRKAGGFERSKHRHAGGEHPGDLLHFVGAGIDVPGRVDRACNDVWVRVGDRRGKFGDLVDRTDANGFGRRPRSGRGRASSGS